MSSQSWRPSATIETLKARAAFMSAIRQFFEQRNVLEVETPLLARSGVTDPHLVNFETNLIAPGFAKGQRLFLQTSPEYHMKRLLCAGSGAIFQLARSFRNEENGRIHNPEFTMLEWYRPGFNQQQLMDEVEALMMLLLNCNSAARISYQQVFIQQLALDPLQCSHAQLFEVACSHGLAEAACDSDRDTLLQLLFSCLIEPKIGQQRPCFVYDFPASQAALAKLNPNDERVAHRFEVYYQGVELANGFDELQDAQQQRQRFEQDNQQRSQMGIQQQSIDTHLIAALAHGLPQCSGVAMGVDRLFMLQQQTQTLSQAMSFGIDNA
ncbi:elongation factor P--(R)-beta-lysine ligase [Paraferrimonas haliotis]|uniref:elongation factor P--(R)-beta-lysine ligase n=1 Tax=Paraferrimonas haliotis TaxID=2013866 RepID=UPI000BA94B50|nr:elongation factor P--(R)-beta-lysine ligase [Paraferrimonas haliotis]